MTFPPLQLPLDGLPNEVRPLFPLIQNGIHAGQGSLGESGGHLFVIYLFPAHFVDITY